MLFGQLIEAPFIRTANNVWKHVGEEFHESRVHHWAALGPAAVWLAGLGVLNRITSSFMEDRLGRCGEGNSTG